MTHDPVRDFHLRLDPETAAALLLHAKGEQRTVVNMVKVIVTAWLHEQEKETTGG